MQQLEDIKDAFELTDDWEDRYQMIIDLGKSLPDMDDSLKTDAHKVEGCVSQVWMVAEPFDENSVTKLHFTADSDAHIVRGLIGLLLATCQDKTPDDIKNTDIEQAFQDLGLENHLTPNRRNGFYAMVQRVKTLADAYQ